MKFMRTWFDQLDDYIESNLYNFSCNDYSELYNSFLNIHKERGRTSENLTGFSEYLANRLMIFLAKDKDLTIKTYEKVNGLLGHNIPDILICNDSNVCGLVSVKAYNDISNATILQDLNRIDNIRTNYKSLLLNFQGHGAKHETTIYKFQREDHKLLFLKGNNRNLSKEICGFLFE